ncbi:YbaB/EbfC family nucleoid-associated protein [Mycobacterium sp. MYCO198283]|uniref:YbaB/EbfC family nucleoid-associated protein n=1 Tax=Mycobacterium sp. MYCO198283 TaxID=2883505 RepID=UPI001E3EDA6A|nr:YbaB/EbfC family nucleoid-associated protein [Mycobacterium sp. MYCO198283]MCG5431704.1 YbaB/EbfC family nucleoid-associated protein [Mycobacterium sp. MYCO198283]
MDADLAAAARRFDDTMARSARTLRVLAEASTGLPALRGTAEADGVVAEVDAAGALTGLRIDDDAVRLPVHRLGELIVAAAAAASADAAHRRAALLAELVRALGT